MQPLITQIKEFSVIYFNREELKILKREIFQNEIYSIDLNNNHPKIFDLGAHIGLATLYFKKMYPSSLITCFEPNLNVFPLLEENVKVNKLSNIFLHNTALGAKECNRDLFIDSSGLGAFSTSSFRKNAWNSKQETVPIEVKVEQLSKYIDSHVDLIKMDVEGAEREIIEELDTSDSFKYIENIIIEYHPIKNHKITEITSILENNKYNIEYSQEGEKIDYPKEDLILIVAKKHI